MSFCPFCGEMRTPVRSAPTAAVTASTTSSRKRAAVLDAAAIAVGALVGAVAQELIDQIAVGAMHLDAVEPGGQRVARALRILRDDAGDLGGFERAGRRDRLEAVRREGLPVRA